ncbi:unnamed protein product, partial [Symbiodinium sp. CCMP2456]
AYRGICQLRLASQYGEGVHLQLLMMLRQLCNDPQGLRASLERRVNAHFGPEAPKDFRTALTLEVPGTSAKEPLAASTAPDFDSRCHQVLE